MRRETSRHKVYHVRDGCSSRTADPGLGRAGRVPETRELVIPDTPYLVPYTVRADVVEIHAVLHGARKWPEHFQ